MVFYLPRLKFWWLFMQQIILKNLRPSFIEAAKTKQSDIWGQEIIFNRGDRIQIIAPSGTGKTSLIHFIYGLRQDYSGKIFFDTQEAKSYSKDDIATLRANELSVIFQDLRLFPGHSAYQNIEIKYLLNPYSSPNKIDEMAAQLGLADKMKQTAGTCSYGEQQRIAIIRALQQPFDFLLLDEPFSHLDEKNREMAMELMEKTARQRGAGIILADLKPIEYFKAQQTLHL